MEINRLRRALEERKELLEEAYNTKIPIRKKYQICGAISEIDLTLKAIEYWKLLRFAIGIVFTVLLMLIITAKC